MPIECPQCKKQFEPADLADEPSVICPECQADMRGPDTEIPQRHLVVEPKYCKRAVAAIGAPILWFLVPIIVCPDLRGTLAEAILFVIWISLPLIGVLFGITAKREIGKSPEPLRGRLLADIAIALSCFFFYLVLTWLPAL